MISICCLRPLNMVVLAKCRNYHHPPCSILTRFRKMDICRAAKDNLHHAGGYQLSLKLACQNKSDVNDSGLGTGMSLGVGFNER
jgi:hypothetical protein